MFKNHWYLWTEQRFTHLAIRSTVDATQFLSTDSTVRFAVSPAIHCLLVRATLEVTISWPWLLLVTPFALPVAITWPEWANQIWEALKCQFHSLCRGGDKVQSQNHGPWPPKPDTYDRYKVFCLKDHILSAKKKSFHGHITFWIFRLFWPIGGHWEKRNQLIERMLLGFSSIDLALLPHWQHPG